MIKKTIIFAVLFCFGFFVFVPKIYIYEHAKKYVSAYGITIHEKTTTATALTLIVKDLDIAFVKSSILQASEAKLSLFILYNTLEISGVKLDILNETIKTIDIKHSVFDPTILHFVFDSKDGNFEGNIDLLDRKGSIIFSAFEKKIPSLVQQFFKKNDKGELSYAISY